jgi:hypothetical protein
MWLTGTAALIFNQEAIFSLGMMCGATTGGGGSGHKLKNVKTCDRGENIN